MTDGILVALLGTAVVLDLRERRVPNWLTVPAAAVGVALAAAPDGIGLWQALGGMAMALAVLLPLYALRAMGAGDVKLFAAAGSFVGVVGTLVALLYALALGGVLAVACAWRAGVLKPLLANLRGFAYVSAANVAAGGAPSLRDLPLTSVRTPYVLAIAGGVLLQQLTWLWLKGTA